MEILYEIDKIKLKSSVTTMGSYDGIHRGHIQILNIIKMIKILFTLNIMPVKSGMILRENLCILQQMYRKSLQHFSPYLRYKMIISQISLKVFDIK